MPFFIVLLLCLSIRIAEAAPPSVTGTSTQYAFFGSTNTTSHTVPSGTNVLLVVFAKLSDTDTTSVTFGGTGMTNVISSPGSSGRQCEIWMLDDPAVSTANIVITGPTAAHAVGAINFTNAAATPVRTANAASASGTSTTPSVNVTAEPDDFVVDVVMTLTGTVATPGAGQALITESDSGANVQHQSSGEAATSAGTVTMSWSGAPNNAWLSCAVPIISANPAAPATSKRREPIYLQ